MTGPAREVVTAPLALDALSAALAVEMGFGAVYLGGGGLGFQRCVSEALLTATEVAEATRAITERIDVAVVVDGTTGFGDAVHTWRTVRMMEQAGAAAIEIEDQLAPKRAHHQKGVDHMIAVDEMAGKVEAAVQARSDPDFLIIARCNALSHDGVDDALRRMSAYSAAGADMLLLLPRSDGEFHAVSGNTGLPLVAMMPTGGRTDSQLADAGYRLKLDAFSATLFGYRAIRAGYEVLRQGRELAGSMDEALDELSEIGATMGIETLYGIEARTTERERYANDRTTTTVTGSSTTRA